MTTSSPLAVSHNTIKFVPIYHNETGDGTQKLPFSIFAQKVLKVPSISSRADGLIHAFPRCWQFVRDGGWSGGLAVQSGRAAGHLSLAPAGQALQPFAGPGHLANQTKFKLHCRQLTMFPNDGCSGETSGLVGVCLSGSECAAMTGGRAEGSCASGFGVCCVSSVTGCGVSVAVNSTHLQNPGYSGPTTEASQHLSYPQQTHREKFQTDF